LLLDRFKPPPYKQPQYDIADEVIREQVINSHDFDIPAMSTPYDAWEAMYYLERGSREHHEKQGTEKASSLFSPPHPPPAAAAPVAPSLEDGEEEENVEIRASFRKSAVREEDLLIVEPFVTNDGVSFSSPVRGLETCLETFAEISNYEEPISPTSVDSDGQDEILKQRQVSDFLTSSSFSRDRSDEV
jgi:hypothetical protein